MLFINIILSCPEEKNAATAIWKAQDYFKTDHSSKALNGDGANPGFLRVISKYGSTKAGNLSKFYCGRLLPSVRRF